MDGKYIDISFRSEQIAPAHQAVIRAMREQIARAAGVDAEAIPAFDELEEAAWELLEDALVDAAAAELQRLAGDPAAASALVTKNVQTGPQPARDSEPL